MDISFYKQLLSNLSVKIIDGQKKPNKAILLLAVIDLMRCGYITENKIFIDKTLELSFNDMWQLYVDNNPPSCWTPFWHLRTEYFWHFKPKKTLFEIENLVPPGWTASLNRMKGTIEYAYFSDDFYQLLKENHTRDMIVSVLCDTYLKLEIRVTEERLLFWTNFKEYLKKQSCPIEFESPSHQPHQITKLKGYDLEFDLCANTKTRDNKWNTRVELYGIKGKKQVERCKYFEANLEKMRKALSDYDIDFRVVSADKESWKLYVGTNDLIYKQCEDVEIYKYYVKALNRMAEAWKPFFEPYKK